MKPVVKLIRQNKIYPANQLKIEKAVTKAIDYAIELCPHTMSFIGLSTKGLIDIVFTYDEPLSATDKHSLVQEAQRNFDEKFSHIIDTEYPELNR